MTTSAVPRWAGTRTAGRTLHQGVRPAGPVSRGLKGLLLTLCCLVVVGPFVAIISTSFAGNEQVNHAGGLVLWPTHPTFAAYKQLLSGGVVTRALFVSLGVTAVGTALSLACTTALAYALARMKSVLGKPLLLIILFTLFFTPGIIPSYLMVKQLHLLNSYWSLILPVLVSGFNVIVMRAFFLEIPQEILDAAHIDGAGELATLVRVVLPLSKAILAVIGLFYAVGYWNSFFTALLYLNDTKKWPLQLILRTYVVTGDPIGNEISSTSSALLPTQQSLQMAILVISLVPILVLYPFIRRHFSSGLMLGAVKG
ncbi:carbohydrate ABC transporter permease [Kribbella sp.]|uniref:carbohydrate ABC transporter permease n=1 Tax=Kribbella sp. TaxID=1871183 RepID=UPI002D4D521B|nr:carbohydrate ABC transporter permease [Kribbella sp.]HZX08751.1 carbohydrate ABC transporter permease [Kribbella sp.]